MHFHCPTLEQANLLRNFLHEAGYVAEEIQKIFGANAMPLPSVDNLQPMLDRTAARNRLNVLIRWFRIGVAVPVPVAELMIEPEALELLSDTGMITLAAGDWLPQMMLTPFRGMLIASDNHSRLHTNPEDYVLTLSPTAKHLYDFAIRKDCDLALDLCAGCGVHAIGLAAHSRQVVSSDFNQRAALYVQFNAALNGHSNVDSVSGDGFAALDGRQFDLIACNPPFVLTPSMESLYRSNPLDVDDFVKTLFRQSPDYLSVGGFFQAIFEWVEVESESWQDRLRSWFADKHCDVLVLKANSELPQTYAKRRVDEMFENSSEDHSDTIHEWIDYYRSFHVRGIHGGLIAIRKTESPGWFRAEEIAMSHRDAFGDYVSAVFDTEDFLRSTTTESMPKARLCLTPELRLLQQSAMGDQGWEAVSHVVAFSDGWHPSLTVDGNIALLLPKFDGQRTVEDLNTLFAELVHASPAQTITDFSEGVRELLRRGVLRLGKEERQE